MPSPVPDHPRSPDATPAPQRGGVARTLRRWFDTGAEIELDEARADRIDWLRAAPYFGLHLVCLGVFWVGASWFAVGMAVAMYAVRMFALTGFYHRYFAHRAFKTSRVVQFLFAALGASCVQRGPLWWAAHHRNHHRHTDTPADPHSPRQHGFWWSHSGWFLTPRGFRTDWEAIPDLRRFPELRFLDRFDLLLPVLLALALFLLGGWLQRQYPQLGTDGPQLLVWGFFVSTVALFHATFTINSLAHRFGSRRFDTRDDSRNNAWLALMTFGEGWHNNHHFFPGAARQGFRWWEIDLTWYGLKALSWTGLIRQLRPVPAGLVRAQARAR
ncbi:acyl-CoA desaturase [Xanthomonas translucens]|uniref:acyl-CoA desaturase n=1 Tax=Xanthomonas campestris pv. translucens TaxID=343 RepID=UPI000AFCB7B0|nr:acyl-CoA desaturase [Xanthomonas translucens]MCS3372367.1 acyl-CoA desaturase [Xanthomonas translucens pv. translucens]MCT8280062.1 acyl-CoA desaturase [Xanthomonas translucens pv. translucens]MCT8284556.1 acyl-CoA desaturase [Xanthomonas translucens pv. translucens]MCT8288602.1 acyl-CoA desaturase [Xanthomonas translucens pv. translucens]MCT8292234.1 acyl-CoA desaturase [Xanthomonas translucens pv. translucens]